LWCLLIAGKSTKLMLLTGGNEGERGEGALPQSHYVYATLSAFWQNGN